MKIALSVFGLVGAVTGAAAQDAAIQVALAPDADPQPRLTALMSRLTARRSQLESDGSRTVQAAFDSALSSAKAQIDAVIGGRRSFLGADQSVRIQPLNGPGIARSSLNRVEELDSMLEDREAKIISQAAAEFGAITKVVVKELAGALAARSGRSFLAAPGGFRGYDNISLRVKPSSIAFPTVMELVAGMEGARDASEASLEGHVLDLEVQFVRRLNEMIAHALH